MSAGISQGTVDTLSAAVASLTALQAALGAAGAPDEHVQAVGSVVQSLATATSEVAAAVPGRSGAEVSAVAGVVAAAVPTFEDFFTRAEGLISRIEALFGFGKKVAAAAASASAAPPPTGA